MTRLALAIILLGTIVRVIGTGILLEAQGQLSDESITVSRGGACVVGGKIHAGPEYYVECRDGATIVHHEKVYPQKAEILNLRGESELFDVAPKEWDGPETMNISHCSQSGICTDGYIEKVHHRTCEDKGRFLLTSEDGKGHCLALIPQ